MLANLFFVLCLLNCSERKCSCDLKLECELKDWRSKELATNGAGWWTNVQLMSINWARLLAWLALFMNMLWWAVQLHSKHPSHHDLYEQEDSVMLSGLVSLDRLSVPIAKSADATGLPECSCFTSLQTPNPVNSRALQASKYACKALAVVWYAIVWRRKLVINSHGGYVWGRLIRGRMGLLPAGVNQLLFSHRLFFLSFSAALCVSPRLNELSIRQTMLMAMCLPSMLSLGLSFIALKFHLLSFSLWCLSTTCLTGFKETDASSSLKV